MLRSSALAICALLCGISALDAQDQFLGKSTVEWASLLKDKDAKVRRNAAFALGKAGRRVGPQIADLRNAFAAEKDPKVKDTIVYSLAQICGEVKDFFTLYTSPNVRDLDNATKLANAYPEICLGKDGGSSDLENIFLNAVADNDPYLRRSGALGLSSLAKKSDATRAALEKALSDQHAMVRQNAAIGLWQFGGDGVPMFRKALRDED
ncbi:MAG: HEAT repeat domain-containing protein [Planctomycetes bacterium]|nr:HEAT repeat domain-containing protein [Planctomycetota bacterium]